MEKLRIKISKLKSIEIMDGVNINIGDYVHFNEKYAGEKGPLDMDYWVLRPNL